MLAKKGSEASLTKAGYVYELKLDGIRAIITVDKVPGNRIGFTYFDDPEDVGVRIQTRRGRTVTDQFPEVAQAATWLAHGVYDCEICCHDEHGLTSFPKITSRLHLGSGIEEASKNNPACAYIFDLLVLGLDPLACEPLSDRRRLLDGIIPKSDDTLKLVYQHDDGQELYRMVRKMGAEGIIAKRSDSLYLPGRRTNAWLKIKVKHHFDVNVVGFTDGPGS